MKKWLIEEFLPMWAKETVLSDNRALLRKNRALRQENRMLKAHLEGIRAGLRGAKRVNIYNRGGSQ